MMVCEWVSVRESVHRCESRKVLAGAGAPGAVWVLLAEKLSAAACCLGGCFSPLEIGDYTILEEPQSSPQEEDEGSSCSPASLSNSQACTTPQLGLKALGHLGQT